MSLYVGYYGYLTGVSQELFRSTLPGLSPEVIKALTFPFFLPSARSLIAFYLILYLVIETLLYPFMRDKTDFKPPFQGIVEKLLKYGKNKHYNFFKAFGFLVIVFLVVPYILVWILTVFIDMNSLPIEYTDNWGYGFFWSGMFFSVVSVAYLSYYSISFLHAKIEERKLEEEVRNYSIFHILFIISIIYSFGALIFNTFLYSQKFLMNFSDLVYIVIEFFVSDGELLSSLRLWITLFPIDLIVLLTIYLAFTIQGFFKKVVRQHEKIDYKTIFFLIFILAGYVTFFFWSFYVKYPYLYTSVYHPYADLGDFMAYSNNMAQIFYPITVVPTILNVVFLIYYFIIKKQDENAVET